MDRYSKSEESKLGIRNIDQEAKDAEQASVAIIRGVENIRKELIKSHENSVGEGDTSNNFVQLLLSEFANQTSSNDQQSTDAVYSSLSSLLNFHLKVNSSIWTRKRHLEQKSKIKFSLGQIVKHKLYNYRGVVIAWDHKPCVDVRNWDGLEHVENPHNKPFYHIRPDENDCVREFGGPRSFRYVCQDNLELCEATELAVEDLNRQDWTWDNANNAYIPSEEIRVSHISLPSCIGYKASISSNTFL